MRNINVRKSFMPQWPSLTKGSTKAEVANVQRYSRMREPRYQTSKGNFMRRHAFSLTVQSGVGVVEWPTELSRTLLGESSD